MTKDDLRKINVEVSNDCWKKLKIISIQKDITLAEHVKDVLEKSVSKKMIEEM